jgi:16S rRNA (guanine966-N2)-methyltransferase
MSVRVIAGSLKHRVLRVREGLATRPTSARVREAVFSILGNLEDLRVLDLYAGSGALGIEALSRGAESAVFVEQDRQAAQCIRENVTALGLGDRTRVLPQAVESALRRLSTTAKFDLVFADPPWKDSERAQKSLECLPVLLSETARLVFEHPRTEQPEIAGLERTDQRTWGDTGVAFFRRTSALI